MAGARRGSSLRVAGGEATLHTDGHGLAWLGVAQRLGFQSRARPWLEGVFLLEPTRFTGVGLIRPLVAGQASWSLGALPPGEVLYLQALVLDTVPGQTCLSDVVRIEADR